MALTPSQVAEKWARNLAGSAEQIRTAVGQVSVSPGEAAISQKQSYLDGVNRAFSDGTYERGLRSFTLQDWQRSMVEKGVPRIAGGATAAKPKVDSFMGQWLPLQDELSRRVAAMPKGSLQDAQARAAFAIQYNAGFRGKFRAR